MKTYPLSRIGKAISLLLFFLFLFPVASDAQIISAPKRDSLLKDNNGNQLANPGDSLRYKLNLINSGRNPATNIVVPDGGDPNTTLNNSSIRTSPLAVNDGPFSVNGNIGITVPAGNGVLGNDFDDNIGALSLVTGTTTTSNGGDFTLNADGSFTYNPPAGFTGVDQATYTVVDGTPIPGCPTTNDATVTFNVADMIWFIDNSQAMAGDGRLSSPFNSMAAFEAVNGTGGTNPAAGQTIFVYTGAGDYTGGVTLENNQKFVGQGMTSSLAVVAGITSGSLQQCLTYDRRNESNH